MTRDEAKQILMSIQAAYPNYKPPDKTISIDTWSCMLDTYTYEQVSAALKAYILSDTSGFPPSIGQIVDKLQMIFGTSELNEMEAWGLVQKALGRSGYYAEEEFEKLPEIVQRAIVSPGQLREWAMMEDVDGRALSVMQSNFMRTFRTEQEREKERRKLSPELKKLVQSAILNKFTHKKPLSISEEREEAEKNRTPFTDENAEVITNAKKNMGIYMQPLKEDGGRKDG